MLDTDKAPTCAAAIAELEAEGKCPTQTRHRQVKYLNNVIEADHGKLKGSVAKSGWLVKCLRDRQREVEA